MRKRFTVAELCFVSLVVGTLGMAFFAKSEAEIAQECAKMPCACEPSVPKSWFSNFPQCSVMITCPPGPIGRSPHDGGVLWPASL